MSNLKLIGLPALLAMGGTMAMADLIPLGGSGLGTTSPTQAGFFNESSVARAQMFTAPGDSSTIYDRLVFSLSLARFSTEVDPSQFSLYLVSDSGSRPNGSTLWSTGLGAVTATTATTYTFETPMVSLGGPSITGGSTYWLVVEQNSTLAGLGSEGIDPNTLKWYAGTSNLGGKSTESMNFSNGAIPTDVWTAPTPIGSSSYGIQIEAVPEPGQVAMMGIFGLGAGVYGWRRFKFAPVAS